MERKYTPEWKLRTTMNDDDFDFEINDVCAVYKNADSEKNARLIHASPDLLEALMLTVDLLEDYKTYAYDQEVIDAARTAIKIATNYLKR